jgi:hypothetical protein
VPAVRLVLLENTVLDGVGGVMVEGSAAVGALRIRAFEVICSLN